MFKKKNQKKTNSKSSFIPVGLVSIDPQEYDADTIEELRTLDERVWLKGYMPKGAVRELKTGSEVFIKFNTKEKDPDFVLGHIYVDSEEGLEDIGSIYTTKKTSKDKEAEFKDSGLELLFTIKLPSDDDIFEVKSGTRMLLSFKTFEDDEDTTVGRVSIPAN